MAPKKRGGSGKRARAADEPAKKEKVAEKPQKPVDDKMVVDDAAPAAAPPAADAKKEDSPRVKYMKLMADLKQDIGLVTKGVESKESRYITRVLRQLPLLRRRVDNAALTTLLDTAVEASTARDAVAVYVPRTEPPAPEPEPMEVEEDAAVDEKSKKDSKDAKKDSKDAKKDDKDAKKDDAKPAPAPKKKKLTLATFTPSAVPEVLAFVHLLTVIRLLDNKEIETAKQCSIQLVQFIETFNRRTMDELAAKAFFYYSRCHELSGRAEFASIRTNLLAAHRTAFLRHNEPGQATLINLLLRNYLEFDLYDQADKLTAKAPFPESASNNEYARYLFYVGKIKSVQLDYSDAHRHLLQAIRKAPQVTAVGFRLTAHKLACLVQLLMGEIPDRSIFEQAALAKGLAPYLELTQTVRDGNLAEFKALMVKHHDLFVADHTYNLVLRLRHNVIKTGLRKINVSYSRISFADVCRKLSLDSPEDAEGIVAKAIRDGVIDAVIDHDNGWIRSHDNIDIYSTHDPQAAFHKRIAFCLNVHNEAIKAMRFPPQQRKKAAESEEERREREKQEEEIAKSLVDDEDDF